VVGTRESFRWLRRFDPTGRTWRHRVVPSNDLKDALLRAGKIEAYHRTYAKRRPEAPVLPAENVVKVQFNAGRAHSSQAKLASEAA
jgi:hypothetical protein